MEEIFCQSRLNIIIEPTPVLTFSPGSTNFLAASAMLPASRAKTRGCVLLPLQQNRRSQSFMCIIYISPAFTFNTTYTLLIHTDSSEPTNGRIELGYNNNGTEKPPRAAAATHNNNYFQFHNIPSKKKNGK